jgi:hypothetical protein
MILFLTLNESESEMKSKLKNVCVVIERNIQIEKIVYENFYMLEGKADKNFLESQIVNWIYFDESDDKERIFFMTYVLRYLSHSDNVKRLNKFKSNDVSALLVVRVNDEDKNDVRSLVELSFHENFEEMSAEVMKIQYMTLMRSINKMREHSLSLQKSV